MPPERLGKLRRVVHAAETGVRIVRFEGQCEIRVNTWVGKRLSLHSSSLGKVLLAWLPPAELDAVLARNDWQRKTATTLVDADAFRAHLREVKARGWAVDDQEDLANIRCVAAPVLDAGGNVVAALSAVGTILDISTERFAPLAEQIGETARQLSRQLGYRA